MNEDGYGCFPFGPSDDKVSTLGTVLLPLLHLGAYLSSIIGFTLPSLPSLPQPAPDFPTPSPLHRWLVIYRSSKSHLTTSLLPSRVSDRGDHHLGKRRKSGKLTRRGWRVGTGGPCVWGMGEDRGEQKEELADRDLQRPSSSSTTTTNQLSSALDRSASQGDSPSPPSTDLFGERCFRRCEKHCSESRRSNKWERERRRRVAS